MKRNHALDLFSLLVVAAIIAFWFGPDMLAAGWVVFGVTLALFVGWILFDMLRRR